MSNYNFEKEIVIVKNEKDYLDKIDNENFENENLDEIVKTLMILQV
jgi:hypothetical protein